ncbi:endophilin-A [Galendromus occidentalis]|uniref:Endophilin-A n=1 Tax=Galendromus occidentalis TaxID=34638 RepID=A0AAJ7SI18_9ACAR|nr:endophilin-A [Galendromus occidentalis]
MAFAGLRKQINKANQYVSEKIGGAEGTKLTEDYTHMEKKVDLTNDLVEQLITQTKELLQPNPATRAKLTVNARLRGPTATAGQASHAYPQPEGILGDSMVKFGTDLGPESAFGRSLIETGESLRQLADIKYSLEDNVKQNFLEPLTQLQQKDLKDVMFHRKKLQGRRLDYDCKKRKRTTGGHVTDEEMRTAGEKFEESFNLASQGMFNLLENDVEQVSQLCALMEAFSEYHQQCAETLAQLTDKLQDLRHEASAKPRGSFEPKKLSDLDQQPLDAGRSPLPSPGNAPGQQGGNMYLGNFNQQNRNARSPNASPIPSPMRSPAAPSPSAQKKPSVQALYDFSAENPGELEFKEGDKIDLIRQIDANWFEGSLNGKSGFFPVNYVEVLVPLQ